MYSCSENKYWSDSGITHMHQINTYHNTKYNGSKEGIIFLQYKHVWEGTETIPIYVSGGI